MGVNKNCQPVIQEWAWKLSWKQQSVLLLGLRGCDVSRKDDPVKPFCKRLRKAVLNFGGGDENCEFMKSGVGLQDIYGFAKQADYYPVHYIKHLLQAAEIVGYYHPNAEEAAFWKEFYTRVVQLLGLNVETKEQNEFRLMDGVNT